MFSTDLILKKNMISAYAPAVKAFFDDLGTYNFTDEELNAVPALFLPGWGEAYSTSVLKIAIAGKETLYWANDLGDSLLTDFNAMKSNSYTPELSCKRFRDQGPAEWFNKFWQYAPSGNRPIADLNIDELLELESLLSQYISSSMSTPLSMPRAQDIRSHIRAYIRCIENKIDSCRKAW